jgi:hypothetical protein
MTTTKTSRARKAAFDATEGPGLMRLRNAKNGEAIRAATLADQKRGRREARARLDAAPAARSGPTAAEDASRAPDAPAPAASPPAPAAAAPARPARPPIEPTPIPVPALKMEGMNAKSAAAFMRGAQGELPEPPDLSAPSTSPSDRKELAALTSLVEAGDIEGLRAYGIRPYYAGAIKLDRYRQCAVIALEARAKAASAA